MKTSADYARCTYEQWIKTRSGEGLLGAYPNAFGDLRELIAAQVQEATDAATATARAKAFTEAKAIAEDWANVPIPGDADEESRHEIEYSKCVAGHISAEIAALASQAEEK